MMTLREYLVAEKLSQVAFAKRIGVSPTEVSLWLSGKRRPGLANATTIETVTGGAIKASGWIPARKVKGRRPAPARRLRNGSSHDHA